MRSPWGVDRGGYGAGYRAPGLGAAERTQAPGPEVHIYMDALSPNDPRFQRVALSAVQEATERYGENARVYHHPRTGS
jgi:hypothetical protein